MELTSQLYLSVAFEEKECIKEMGAKYNAKAKLWWVEATADPLQFQEWWTVLEDTYQDKEQIKLMGAKFCGEISQWYVPHNLEFFNFIKWWPKDLKQYLFQGRFLAKEKLDIASGQADVFRGTDMINNSLCAIKLFKVGSNASETDKFDAGYKKERHALITMEKNSYVMPLEEWDKHKMTGRDYIVMPWLPYTLSDIIGKSDEECIELFMNALSELGEGKINIEKRREKKLTELKDRNKNRWVNKFDTYLLHLLDGICACHSAGFYHRDIKPQNIFLEVDASDLKSSFKVVLGDFGIAKHRPPNSRGRTLIQDNQKTLFMAHTTPWTPPRKNMDAKTFNEVKFQQTWDIWSWAAVAVSLIIDKELNDMNELESYLNNEFKLEVDDDIWQLIMSAFAKNPEDRPKDATQFRDSVVNLTNNSRGH